MGILDRVKSFGSDLTNEVKRFNNSTFLEAACATACLISAADGNIDSEEKAKTLGFMQINESLKVFDTSKVISTFQKFADMYAFDPGMGNDACFEAISKVKNKPEQARACVRLGCVIGAADGSFDKDEQEMVRKVALCLGLDPAEFLS